MQRFLKGVCANTNADSSPPSIRPRRDTPRRSIVVNLEFQTLQLPLGVHVHGRSHGLSVSRTDAGGASICKLAPYASRVSTRPRGHVERE